MANELDTVEKWLYTTLTGDSALAALVTTGTTVRVYARRSPQPAVFPYVLFGFQQGADLNALSARALAQPLYQVKAIGKQQDTAACRALGQRIDALLQDTQVTLDGFRIRCQRESPLNLPDNDSNGIEYIYIGGMYRCWISPAS